MPFTVQGRMGYGEIKKKVVLCYGVLFLLLPPKPCKCFVGPDFVLDGCLVCFFSVSPGGFLLSFHYSLACLLKAGQRQSMEVKLRLDHSPSW